MAAVLLHARSVPSFSFSPMSHIFHKEIESQELDKIQQMNLSTENAAA
jgi:hypothetical protein